MSSQVTSHSRAENSADLLRVLVALGLLALLASLDGEQSATVVATPAGDTAGDTAIAPGHASTDASSSGLQTPGL